jgi:hypothetical protein
MTPIAVPEPTVTVAAELTERCDRCGAAGKLRIFLPGGGDLTFCGHHANRFGETIRGSAERVVVESGFGWRATSAA